MKRDSIRERKRDEERFFKREKKWWREIVKEMEREIPESESILHISVADPGGFTWEKKLDLDPTLQNRSGSYYY